MLCFASRKRIINGLALLAFGGENMVQTVSGMFWQQGGTGVPEDLVMRPPPSVQNAALPNAVSPVTAPDALPPSAVTAPQAPPMGQQHPPLQGHMMEVNAGGVVGPTITIDSVHTPSQENMEVENAGGDVGPTITIDSVQNLDQNVSKLISLISKDPLSVGGLQVRREALEKLRALGCGIQQETDRLWPVVRGPTCCGDDVPKALCWLGCTVGIRCCGDLSYGLPGFVGVGCAGGLACCAVSQVPACLCCDRKMSVFWNFGQEYVNDNKKYHQLNEVLCKIKTALGCIKDAPPAPMTFMATHQGDVRQRRPESMTNPAPQWT